MEWKKEKISGAELERKQKEYMNAAMSMVKRSHIPEQPVMPEPEPVPEEPAVPDTSAAEVTVAEDPVTEEAPAASGNTGETPEPEAAHEQEPTENENYGVYTADELLNGKTEGEGLKKAAEILEEMTRNTEIMRRLANEDSESGTTDFPDFSCDKSEDGSCRFRENDRKTEDGTPPDGEPEARNE